MRELTSEERAIRDERRARLEQMLEESMPVLTDFLQKLGHPDAARVAVEAERFAGALDAFLRHQVIGPDDRAWALARLAYFVGEVFVQRHGGVWFLDDDPASRFFLRVVVGRFTDGADPGARFDPFEVAAALLDQPPPRSLSATIDNVERELRA